MKKLFTFVFAIITASAFGAAGDVIFKQINPTNTAIVDRVQTNPSAIRLYGLNSNAGTWQPTQFALGTGFSIAGSFGSQTLNFTISPGSLPSAPYTALPFTLGSGTLLGRTTALPGAAEEITPGSSLSFSAGALNTIQDIRTTATPTFAGITSPIGATTPSTGAFTSVNANASIFSTNTGDNAIVSVKSTASGGKEWWMVSSSTASGLTEGFSIFNATDGVTPFHITGAGKVVMASGIEATAIGATIPSTGVFTDVSGTNSVYAGNTGFALGSGSTDGIYMLPVGALVSSRDGQRSLAVRRRNSDGEVAAFFRDTSQVGSISVTTTATAYNTSSDRRLKTSIRDFNGSAAIIDAIKPRMYDWKTGEKDTVGFIAQELYEAYPASVTKGDDDAEKIERQWAVDYSKLIPVLVAEIQSLRARVAELEKERK